MTRYFDVGVAFTQGARDNQQDSFVTTAADGGDASFDQLDYLLLAVADGVGGAVAGEVASAAAVNAFARCVQQSYEPDSGDEVKTGLLKEAAHYASNVIRQKIRADISMEGMATTLVAVLVEKQRLYSISIGDSLLFLLRNGDLTKLNDEHNIGTRLDKKARAGEISAEEAAGYPDREVLYSVLDGEEIVEIDLPIPLELRVGDRFILASDGLLTLRESVLIELAESETNAQDYAERLIGTIDKFSLRGQDNATVVVLDIKGSEPETKSANSCSTLPFSCAVDESAQSVRTPRQTWSGIRGKAIALFLSLCVGIVIGGWVFFNFYQPPVTVEAANTEQEGVNGVETQGGDRSGFVEENDQMTKEKSDAEQGRANQQPEKENPPEDEYDEKVERAHSQESQTSVLQNKNIEEVSEQ